MKLRKIIYADNNAINDYISSIEGYLCEEKEIIENSVNKKEGNLDFKKIGGSLGKQKEESIKYNAKDSLASKIDRVIDYLKNEDELRYYEMIDEEIWKSIFRDDFIEVLVTPRFSKLKGLSNTINDFMELYNSISPFLDKEIIKSDDKKIINQFDALANSKTISNTTCVFNFANGKYPLIGEVNEDYLLSTADNFTSEVNMLCKVQRKIESGNSISLDEMFDDIKKMPLNRSSRRKLSNKDLSNPDIIKDKINGPAFVVMPIAIYK